MSAGTGPKGHARALMEIGRHQQAAEHLARHLAQHPGDAQAWAQLAHCRFKAGDWEGALKAADDGIAADSRCDDAWRQRALVLPYTGLEGGSTADPARVRLALEAAREAVRIDPQEPANHSMLARYLGLTGNQEEAYHAALTAVALDPENPTARFNLAHFADVTGRPDVREQTLRETLRLDPDHADARATLAELQAEAGRMKLPELAGEYGAALGARPHAGHIENKLNLLVLRLLRRTRWFALLCLVIAALAARACPTKDDATALPAPLGTRLWAATVMGLVWTVGAWYLAYRRLPHGARTNLRSQLRRRWAARLPLLHAAWGTALALVTVLVPLTDRGTVQTLVLTGAVPVVLAMWYGSAQRRVAREQQERTT
ncbi:tetratricopeptide repeat protein [Streptomyces sp. NPDC049585]|uniref:tetratricopeptide repeat protein n=1 Tax=Streptomyces sp. NPDC049585 TaxID=3155154 RepID=UPI00344793A0